MVFFCLLFFSICLYNEEKLREDGLRESDKQEQVGGGMGIKGSMDHTLEVKITQQRHNSEWSLRATKRPSELGRLPVNNIDNKLIACRSAPVAAWRLPARALTPLLLCCPSPWARHTRSWRHVTAVTWKNENRCRPSWGDCPSEFTANSGGKGLIRRTD